MEIQYLNTSNDLLFSVNPQAAHDLWIISDYDSSEKMFRFHQLRDTAKADDYYANWYIFRNFDIYTHTSTATGFQLSQIINSVISMLNSYRRLPHSLVIIMGEKLMHDKLLQIDDVEQVLAALCKKVLRAIECWMEKVPFKVLPQTKPRIYITKPLPKPESFYQGNLKEKFAKFASVRRSFNTSLVKVVQQFGIGFINVGINQTDHTYFKRTQSNNKFALTDKGLIAYWEGISNALEKLATVRIPDKNNSATTIQLKVKKAYQ